MAIVSYIGSLMEFNRRVLSQGSIPTDCRNIDAADLNRMLFFNSVFISNTIEMYQKHPMENMNNDYVEGLNEYIRNIKWIETAFTRLYPDIMMSRQLDFEARLIATDIGIKDQIINGRFDGNTVFDPTVIYYLSIISDGEVILSFIDPKRSTYHSPIKNRDIYYKTDKVIMDVISRTSGTSEVVAIQVTCSNNTPTKVEFNGNAETMRKLLKFFPSTCLVVSNPYIYTNDIGMMISSKLGVKEITMSNSATCNFSRIHQKDMLIEFPRDSFDEYLQFLRMAANGKNTSEIYLTLYRIGADPAIFYILRDAVNNGIRVHVNIELMASGEDINMLWLKEMQSVGIKVTTYACGQLKVHTKLTVIRFTNGTIMTQIGTGNYHTKTTTQYTDLCLITGDFSIGCQALNLFRLFAGADACKLKFNNDFLVSRYNARSVLIELIQQEAKKEENGYILIKCNALDDPEIIAALEHARRSGCIIYAIVRGVCTWVPDESDNVTIKSVIWNKLEHSRVYSFGRKYPVIYMGSLDLVKNKLDNRIESLVRIKDPDVLYDVCEYLNKYVTNTKESWIQTRSGIYIKES